jgi:hypothetical protein
VDRAESEKLLGIYLNDHLAGSSAGLALARRIADNHRRTTMGEATAEIAIEIGEDRVALIDLMSALGVRVKRSRNLAAVLAERAGRLKLNGRLLTRSPLSSVIELEGMRLGVEGKLAGWRSLRRLADDDARLDPVRLDELCQRAERQIDSLERMRIDSVDRAFGRG